MTKNCPTCQQSASQGADNAFRPFCSKRCQMVDLGAWLSEAFAIEGEPVRLDVDSERQESER